MYHKIIFAGHLGRDPEMKYTADGKAFTTFNVAVSSGYGESKTTIWFRCTVWEKRAETANQYLTKGSKVLIDGRLRVDPATGAPTIFTRKDGTAGTTFEVAVADFTFLSSRGDDAPKAATVQEDDVPF